MVYSLLRQTDRQSTLSGAEVSSSTNSALEVEQVPLLLLLLTIRNLLLSEGTKTKIQPAMRSVQCTM